MKAIAKRKEGSLMNFTTSLVVFCIVCFGIGWYFGAGSSSQIQAPVGSTGGVVVQKAVQTNGVKPLAWKPSRITDKCDDTCSEAKDGKCDEGRSLVDGVRTPVYCDLGTDCTDCGAWVGQLPPNTWPKGGPVAHLRESMNVPLFTKTTLTTPPFQMLYTDPKADVDVSANLDASRIVERGITEVFSTVLKDRCVDKATGIPRLVLDVGANFGYFAIYAAKLGCRVVAWEPVPHFRAFVEHAIALNGVAHLVQVRDRGISEINDDSVVMMAPTKGIWGTASVAGISLNEENEPFSITVRTERIDAVISEDVLLMKVDVEGYEAPAIESAHALWTDHAILNIVLEYNPGVAELAGHKAPVLAKLVLDNPRMLTLLKLRNYTIGMMNDDVSKGHLGLKAIPEVTLAGLRYDLADAAMFSQGWNQWITKRAGNAGVNCPVQLELSQVNGEEWGSCSRMPEDAHPKSLRSFFTFNTNLWATMEPHFMQLKGEAALFQPSVNARTTWAAPSGTLGLGQRSCLHIPPSSLVRNRCNCSYAVTRNLTQGEVQACFKEEAIVQRLLRDNLMHINDYSHPIK